MTEIEIIVGDTGITLSGQLNGGGLTTLAGSAVKLDILAVEEIDGELRLTGRKIVENQTATITDAANRRVSYKLQAADVIRRGRGIIRWTVSLPASGGDVHVPGPKSDQVVLQINP